MQSHPCCTSALHAILKCFSQSTTSRQYEKNGRPHYRVQNSLGDCNERLDDSVVLRVGPDKRPGKLKLEVFADCSLLLQTVANGPIKVIEHRPEHSHRWKTTGLDRHERHYSALPHGYMYALEHPCGLSVRLGHRSMLAYY